MANGMRLCVTCHHAFDSSEYPAWVFIPSDLDFFITHERADLTRREHEYETTGVWPVRECPPIEEYVEEAGGLYDVYMLRDYGHKKSGWRPGRSTLLPHSKQWHGDAMSTLFKGFNASGRHSLFLPSKLRILNEMYQRNDLGPRGRATNTNRDNHDGSQGDDHGNGRGNEPLGPSTFTATPTKSNPLAKDPATQRSETLMNEPLAGGYGTSQERGQKRSHEREEEDPEPKRVKVEMSPWAWGPHKTSSDRAEYYKVKMKAMEGWARLRDTSKERIKHAPAHLPSPEPSEKESKNAGHEWSGSRRVLKWLSETKQVDSEQNYEEIGKKNDYPV
ncbi:MAG: hypothetical protein LQ344_006751 [Seirophora lacunosa]|nr:MAG: hypothetical protein LQ344_006751 [Seirophora lacunosa]